MVINYTGVALLIMGLAVPAQAGDQAWIEDGQTGGILKIINKGKMVCKINTFYGEVITFEITEAAHTDNPFMQFERNFHSLGTKEQKDKMREFHRNCGKLPTIVKQLLAPRP